MAEETKNEAVEAADKKEEKKEVIFLESNFSRKIKK